MIKKRTRRYHSDKSTRCHMYEQQIRLKPDSPYNPDLLYGGQVRLSVRMYDSFVNLLPK